MKFKLLLSISLLCTISMCSKDVDQLAMAFKDIVVDSFSGIVAYDSLKDREAVLQILKPDALLLIDGADSVESAMKELGSMLDSKNTYPKTPLYNGTLLINVYRDNGKIAGVIAYETDNENPKIGNIVIVAIGQKYRRRGYAEKLFKYAIQYFKDKNCVEAKLWVKSNNKNAQKLYEKIGFTCAEIEKMKNVSSCIIKIV